MLESRIFKNNNVLLNKLCQDQDLLEDNKKKLNKVSHRSVLTVILNNLSPDLEAHGLGSSALYLRMNNTEISTEDLCGS